VKAPKYVDQDCGFETPCWVWQGALNRAGYGKTADPTGMVTTAHRVYWERENGPVPSGMEIDHLCRNRACVNPSHMEPVTHAENIRRCVRTHPTHCANGHEYTTENTNQLGTRRRCRACARTYRARYRASHPNGVTS